MESDVKSNEGGASNKEFVMRTLSVIGDKNIQQQC